MTKDVFLCLIREYHIFCKGINSLWSLCLDTQHGTAIYWAKYCCANIILFVTSVFTFKMADHYGNHGCLEEKNVTTAAFCPIDGKVAPCRESTYGDHTLSMVMGSTDLMFYMVRFCCFVYVELTTDLLARLNPNHSKRRSDVQTYELIEAFSRSLPGKIFQMFGFVIVI